MEVQYAIITGSSPAEAMQTMSLNIKQIYYKMLILVQSSDVKTTHLICSSKPYASINEWTILACI